MTKYVLPILLVVTISGCASVASTPRPVHHDLSGIETLSTTASINSLIIKSDHSQKQFCAQPMADATFSDSEGNSISLVNVPGNQQGESMNDTSASDEMQGRAPAVLMARELFYRLCEFSLNHPGNFDTILPLYARTLDVIEAGWMKESDQYTIQESVTTTETITSDGLQAPASAE